MKQQTLGATIAALRKERGMTQLELAQSNGRHRQGGEQMGAGSFP